MLLNQEDQGLLENQVYNSKNSTDISSLPKGDSLNEINSNAILKENIEELKSQQSSHFIKQKRQELISLLHDLEKTRFNIRNIERQVKVSIVDLPLD